MQTHVVFDDLEVQVVQMALELLNRSAPTVVLNDQQNEMYREVIGQLIDKIDGSEKQQHPVIENA